MSWGGGGAGVEQGGVRGVQGGRAPASPPRTVALGATLSAPLGHAHALLSRTRTHPRPHAHPHARPPTPTRADEGVVDIKANAVTLKGEPRVLHRDAVSGAATVLYTGGRAGGVGGRQPGACPCRPPPAAALRCCCARPTHPPAPPPSAACRLQSTWIEGCHGTLPRRFWMQQSLQRPWRLPE